VAVAWPLVKFELVINLKTAKALAQSIYSFLRKISRNDQ
jgi:hypothetical protein